MPRLAEAIVSSTVRPRLPARIRVRGISTKPLSWNTSAPSVTGWPHDLAAAQPLWHGGVLKAGALGSIARKALPPAVGRSCCGNRHTPNTRRGKLDEPVTAGLVIRRRRRDMPRPRVADEQLAFCRGSWEHAWFPVCAEGGWAMA